MKFNCSVQKLMVGLVNATRALGLRPAMQILEGVMIKTGENEVFLTCTDGSLSIRSRVDAVVEEQGSVVLPGKLLTEIVRKLPEDEVFIQMNEKMAVSLKCRQSRSTLTGMSSEDFPQMKDIVYSYEIELPQKRMRDMISKVVFAIAIQESRQALTGCLMEVTKEELRLVGLDGFRLSLQRLRGNFIVPEDKEQVNAIIPGHVMNEMGRIMTDEENLISFHLDNTHLMAIMGDTTLVTSLLAGEYINYRQILPETWITRITVKKKEMQDSIERASLMAREGKNNLIRLHASDDHLEISSMSEMGDVLEEMGIHLEGEEIEIAFNSRYISDVIKNVDDDCCMMSMNTNMSPCVVSPVEGDAYLFLVLPVRVSN